MPIKKISATEIGDATSVSLLIYGQSGAGKTYAASTATTLGKVLVIDTEKGRLSLQGAANVDIIPFDSFNELRRNFGELVEEIKNYSTIVIDSLSECAEDVLGEEKAKAKDPRLAYGRSGDSMTNFLRRMKEAAGQNINLVYICKLVENNDTGTTKYRPSVLGKGFSQSIPYPFDGVFLLEKHGVVEDKRRFTCKITESSLCKDRSGKLSQYEPAHLGYIISKMLGKKELPTIPDSYVLPKDIE